MPDLFMRCSIPQSCLLREVSKLDQGHGSRSHKVKARPAVLCMSGIGKLIHLGKDMEVGGIENQ